MKILLTCGHRYSGADTVHRTLVAGGLAEALPSRREGMTAATFHERILKAHGVDPNGAAALTQIRPGKVWEDLAVDLFLGNLDRRQWGWEDPATAWLLEFWADFDPQVGFLLVYASPRSMAARALTTGGVSPHQIEQVMASWQAQQLEVLRFYHRHRDRCLLVNAQALPQAPEAFIGRVARAFQLDLRAVNAARGDGPPVTSAIASVLVEGLLGTTGEPQSLYADLEGYADIPESDAEAVAAGWGSAWAEYRRLVRDLGTAEEALRLQSLRCDELALRGADTDAALVAAKAQIKTQRERIEELGRLVERSVSDWNAQVKLETELRGALQRQAGELERLQGGAGALGDCERRCAELEQELQSQRDALAAAQTAVAEQAGHNAQLANDNGELLQQLQAVQEELETYFLRCEELSASVPAEPVLTAGGVRPWGAMTPAEILFDMRGDVDGDNWYYPEADGRWAGPEPVSTLHLPALGAGRYEVRLQVADAMTPEILAGMRVFLNDMPLTLEREGKRYPASLTGQFSIDAGVDDSWTLRLEFPGLVSPADRGSDDRRRLAIRLGSVRLTAVLGSGT